ncbi:hypothetical protein ACFLY2_00920 [Patescibacteria group bacterium]
MKKIIVLVLSILISLSMVSSSNAASLENKLYKSVIISKFQISKDYKDGKSYNNKIRDVFIKMRYFKERETLNKLEVLLKERIREFNAKEVLLKNERKKLNLYNNLYYRTKLLLDFQLK